MNLNNYLDRLPVLAYTKEGELVIITDKDDDPDYPFVSIDGAESYAHDGTARSDRDLAYVLDDIVIPKFNAPLIIRAGRKYKTRGGDVVEIVTTEGRHPSPVIGYTGQASLPHAWTSEGHFVLKEDGDSELDLIEEI